MFPKDITKKENAQLQPLQISPSCSRKTWEKPTSPARRIWSWKTNVSNVYKPIFTTKSILCPSFQNIKYNKKILQILTFRSCHDAEGGKPVTKTAH